jgi:protein involved in polysaccharide export with SLBB domain
MKSPWQFRLRTLMIAVLVLALASWYGVKLTRNMPSALIIQPTDFVQLSMKQDLVPGRPITGRRLVRSDGRIVLGYYGDVDVAGLTESDARDKIALHLRKFSKDENLGHTRKQWGSYDRPSIQPIDLDDPSQFSVSISP